MPSPALLDPFLAASGAFVQLVSTIGDEQWTQSGLGTWDVRGLVGHTARSLANLPAYLRAAPRGPLLDDPVAYYLTVLPPGDEPARQAERHRAIAERGQAAGLELGDRPAALVAELAEQAQAALAGVDDQAPCQTPAGPMTLAGYLPTRTFELTVHTLDLARAIGQPPPAALGPALPTCCELAGRLAGQRPDAADLLLLLTGRPVAGGLSVV
ncbi:maleylpyruvate isomerase N-terminal domain-containing protein [Aciditerrimonas ferrireducens]|uniref:Maleylpyruvate isomerase N-terminal domain-containing protein n=1 Tax=Aciditerrimonas ferrireducens TaxID=667306 RepID=A0ABV6BZ01_9ACTN|nr:maleylpyruvate isomerase N-terminal domain-containing protein [Aciditerrimonas ferrireducens]MCK4176874.1 maleylpyruvate isomerase N-terminal domain-containing protein [Aciditerrimonas ferrireducens]